MRQPTGRNTLPINLQRGASELGNAGQGVRMPAWKEIENNRSPKVRALHAWWHQHARASGMPDRCDVDPIALKDLLPNLFNHRQRNHHAASGSTAGSLAEHRNRAIRR